MSKFLSGNINFGQGCCSSKSLSNINPLVSNSSSTVSQFVTTQNQSNTSSSNSNTGVTTSIDTLNVTNTLTVLGSSNLSTITSNNITIGSGVLTLDNAGNISSNTGNITLHPLNDSPCVGEVTISDNLTVNGCYTHLCTGDFYIQANVSTIGICSSNNLPVDDNDDRGFSISYTDPDTTNVYTGFFGYDKDRMTSATTRWVFWYDAVLDIGVHDTITDKNYYRNPIGTRANGLEADIIYTYLIKNPDNPQAPINLLGNNKNDISIEATNSIITMSFDQIHQTEDTITYDIGTVELHQIGTSGNQNLGRFTIVDINNSTTNFIELSDRFDGIGGTKGLFLNHNNLIDIITSSSSGIININAGSSQSVNISPVLGTNIIQTTFGSTIVIRNNVQIVNGSNSRTLQVDTINECLTSLNIATVTGTNHDLIFGSVRNIIMNANDNLDINILNNITIDTTTSYISLNANNSTNGYIQMKGYGSISSSLELSNGNNITNNSAIQLLSENSKDILLDSDNNLLIYTSNGQINIDGNKIYIWGNLLSLETFGSNSPINLISNGNTSPINIQTNNSNIVISTNVSGNITIDAINDISILSNGSTGITINQTNTLGNIVIESSGYKTYSLASGSSDVGIYLNSTNSHDIALFSSEDIEIDATDRIFLDTVTNTQGNGYIQSTSRGYLNNTSINNSVTNVTYEISTLIQSLNNHDIYINAKSSSTGTGTFIINPGIEFQVQPLSNSVPINPGRIPSKTIYFNGSTSLTSGLRTNWISGSGISEKLYVLSDVDIGSLTANPPQYDGWVALYKNNSGHLIEPSNIMRISSSTVIINGILNSTNVNNQIYASSLIFDNYSNSGLTNYNTNTSQSIISTDNFRVLYLDALNNTISISNTYSGSGTQFLATDGTTMEWIISSLQSAYNSQLIPPATISLSSIIEQIRIINTSDYNNSPLFEVLNQSSYPYFQINKTSSISGTINIGNQSTLSMNMNINNGSELIICTNGINDIAFGVNNNSNMSIFSIYPNRTGNDKNVIINGNLDVSGSIDPTSLNMQGNISYPSTLPSQISSDIYLWNTNDYTNINSGYAINTLYMRKGTSINDLPIITGQPLLLSAINFIPIFDTNTGESISVSGVNIDENNNVTGINNLTFSSFLGNLIINNTTDTTITSSALDIYNATGTVIFQVTPNQTGSGKNVTITGNLDVSGSIDPIILQITGCSSYPLSISNSSSNAISIWATDGLTSPINSLFVRQGTSTTDIPLVIGPIVSNINSIPVFNTNTGNIIKSSNVIIDSNNNMTGVATLTRITDITSLSTYIISDNVTYIAYNGSVATTFTLPTFVDGKELIIVNIASNVIGTISFTTSLLDVSGNGITIVQNKSAIIIGINSIWTRII